MCFHVQQEIFLQHLFFQCGADRIPLDHSCLHILPPTIVHPNRFFYQTMSVTITTDPSPTSADEDIESILGSASFTITDPYFIWSTESWWLGLVLYVNCGTIFGASWLNWTSGMHSKLCAAFAALAFGNSLGIVSITHYAIDFSTTKDVHSASMIKNLF